MSAKYEQVDGVEWCVVHHGILDECGPDRTVILEDDTEFTSCDLYDAGDEPCDVRTLWIEVTS